MGFLGVGAESLPSGLDKESPDAGETGMSPSLKLNGYS